MKENPRRMMGFETPADTQVKISMRDWDALKRALWRSSVGWEITMRAASEIIQRCRHIPGCPAESSEIEPCQGGLGVDLEAPKVEPCPDRETRMDALVILNAARMHAPTNAAKGAADQLFVAPSREYYGEILAALIVAQAQLEALRAAGVVIPEPPSRGGTLVLPPTNLPQLQPKEEPSDETESATE